MNEKLQALKKTLIQDFIAVLNDIRLNEDEWYLGTSEHNSFSVTKKANDAGVHKLTIAPEFTLFVEEYVRKDNKNKLVAYEFPLTEIEYYDLYMLVLEVSLVIS